MTLTTFSSKQFKPLYAWALKRNKIIALVFAFFLLLFGPVLDLYCISVDDFTEELGMISLVIFDMISALFTLISALKTFSFMHNKRSVDLYGALPSNRTTLFISHLLGGITAISLPYLVISILTIGIACRSADTFKFGLFSIAANLLMIIAAYTFTALIAYCCGTLVDTAIISFALNAIWIGMVGIYYILLDDMIPGIDFDSIIGSPTITALSPYGFSLCASGFYAAEELPTAISIIVWNIIFIVCTFFLTLYVANKRRSEVSQNGFAVKWLPIVVQAGASVVAGGIIGMIAAETAESGYGNMIVFSFWFVITGFAAFIVLYIIFNRGFKGKKLPSVITYVCTMAVSISLLFGLTYGLGIDTYVPSPSTIKKVSIDYEPYVFTNPENIKTITEIHKVIAQGIRKSEDYPYFLGYTHTDYYNYDYPVYDEEYDDYANDTFKTYDEPEAAYDTMIEPEWYPDSLQTQYPYVDYLNYKFKYTRKIGLAVIRGYYISPTKANNKCYDLKKLNELSRKLVSSQEFKEQNVSALYDSDLIENITSIDLTYQRHSNNYGDDYFTTGTARLSTYPDITSPLFEALKEDIAADESFVPTESWGDIPSYFSRCIGKQYIEFKITYNKSDNNTYNYEVDRIPTNTNTRIMTIIVKPTYTNTMKLLNEYGVKPEKKPDYNSAADYPESYYNFCDTGNYAYLEELTRSECYNWASIACDVYEINYNEWSNEYFDKYQQELLDKTDELYKQHSKRLAEQNGYVDNTELADAIYMDLITYAFEYVEKSSGLMPDYDTDTASDTDSAKATTTSSTVEM